MKPELFCESWRAYLNRVLSPKLSMAQVKERRRAFYAGALAALEIIVRTNKPEGYLLSDELFEFHDRVREGKD